MVEENSLIGMVEPPEAFENMHELFRAIPKILWKQWRDINKIQPKFFQTKHALAGLSVDWSKYSNPQDTLERRGENANLENYGIGEMNVGKLRKCIEDNDFPIEIKHDPFPKEEPSNQAHTLLVGFTIDNRVKIRKEISKIVKWAPGMIPILTD